MISSPPCDLRLSFLRSMNVEAHKVRLIVCEWMETESYTYSRSYVVLEHLGTCFNFLLCNGGTYFFLCCLGGVILKNGVCLRPQFVLSCQLHLLLQNQMMHFDNTYTVNFHLQFERPPLKKNSLHERQLISWQPIIT